MADTYYCGATQIALGVLGASMFPTQIKPPPGCVGMDVQYQSGGSIMILPNTLASGTVSGATAITTIPGYLISTTIALNLAGPIAFYVACASSVTAVMGINFHYSAGGASLV